MISCSDLTMRHRKQTYLQRALADKNSVDISPPRSSRDDYLIGIEIFDRRDGTPQLLSLRELSALTPDEGKLAIVVGEGSAWVADGNYVEPPVDDDDFYQPVVNVDDDNFYQPVVNVFLLRRLDGKILTLIEGDQGLDSFEAWDIENGHAVTLGRTQTVSGTGADTPWKEVMLETTILCHSETRTKTLTIHDKPVGFSFEQAGVDFEQPGKSVTGVRQR